MSCPSGKAPIPRKDKKKVLRWARQHSDMGSRVNLYRCPHHDEPTWHLGHKNQSVGDSYWEWYETAMKEGLDEAAGSE